MSNSETEKNKRDLMTNLEITNYSPKSRSLAGILYSDLELIDQDFTRKFENHELRCSVCGGDLFENGIYAVVEENSKIKWCCNNIECAETFK